MIDISSLRRSPFGNQTQGPRPNSAGEIGVRLKTSLLASVILVHTWPDGTTGLEQALGQALGVEVPQRTGQTVCTPAGVLLMRSGPQECLLVADTGLDWYAELRRSIPPELGSVTDLSHARCRIHLEGDKCLEVLAKLFALPLSLTDFPVHETRLSGHHHVPCTLHRLGQREFALFVFTTYAQDQLDSLWDAALEYGVTLIIDGTL